MEEPIERKHLVEETTLRAAGPESFLYCPRLWRSSTGFLSRDSSSQKGTGLTHSAVPQKRAGDVRKTTPMPEKKHQHRERWLWWNLEEAPMPEPVCKWQVSGG